MSDYTDARALLRRPFPDDAVDKLPKGVDKSKPKASCRVCGGYHEPAKVHLDYVGHAQTTARLLDADPEWSWEPMGYEEDGQPALARKTDGTPYGLWIRLHVCGVHRIGFGELPASKGADGVKEAIGDAIRNAAMRFGVALDLWAKGELVHEEITTSSAAPTLAPEAKAEEPAAGEDVPPRDDSPAATPEKKKLSKKRKALNDRFHSIVGDLELDYEGQVRYGLAKKYDGRTLSGLTDDELHTLVTKLGEDEAVRQRFRAMCVLAAPAEDEGAA